MRTVCTFVVVALAACSSETAVLVAVTGSSVEELEFYVGVLDTEGDHVLVPGISGERIEVRGRNLRANPYELMLRKDDQVPAGALNVRVLALAYRQQDGEMQISGFGLTEPPQKFIDGEVVRRAVSLGSMSNRSVEIHGDCVRVRVGEDHFDLVADDDRDCDGSKTADDCKDSDPGVFPGAIERCDGKDNNCDGQFAPRDQRCYAWVGEGDARRCFAGSRVCLDAEGKGFDGDCKTAGEPVHAAYCEAYDRCGEACAALITVKQLSCFVEVAAGAEGKKICPDATWTLARPSDGKGCKWQVASKTGIEVKLKGKDGAAGHEIESCEPTVQMLAFGALPAADARATVVYTGKPAAVFEATFTPKIVEACSDQPMICK